MELKAELVHVHEKLRFLKLNTRIQKGMSLTGEVNITEKDLEYFTKRVKPEFRDLMPVGRLGTDIICISDARDHYERLVFSGFEYVLNGKRCYSRTDTQIGGVHTFSIYGGDFSSMKPDEVYLRILARQNGLTFHNNK